MVLPDNQRREPRPSTHRRNEPNGGLANYIFLFFLCYIAQRSRNSPNSGGKRKLFSSHLHRDRQPALMPRILSISYNKALLHTRELMLLREGFEVESAVGFSAALHACENGKFDLMIMGHSIPPEDKAAIIKQLRAVCKTPILALRRPDEPPVKGAEYNLDSGVPERFIGYVRELTNSLKNGPS
jgi:CheY-like chemotaxis protein